MAKYRMYSTAGFNKVLRCTRIVMVLMILAIPRWVAAQYPTTFTPHGWQLMAYQKDSVRGTEVNRAYAQLLQGKKGQPVIVAVIDAGLDTSQEDLQGHIWTNPGEIANNGIDDDHNGYVDDIHGWNFLGGKDGRYMTKESLESEREYYLLKPRFGARADSSALAATDQAAYAIWVKVKKAHQKTLLDESQRLYELTPTIELFAQTDSILKKAIGRDTLYKKDIDAFVPKDPQASRAKETGEEIFKEEPIAAGTSLEQFVADGRAYLDQSKTRLEFTMDPESTRRDIVGDNPYDLSDRNYGNNNIAVGTPVHGTHVAGIIAAIRGNGIGMDGVTDNVLLMGLRVVPSGDERDKDIALAIRYAVDNGARVINMSFGKYYSPNKSWVDESVKYAAQHDVLLVHAAGNESKNLDLESDFPNPNFENSNLKAENFITVGATTGGPDSMLVANFSNYGAKEVDLFAPGVNMYSTVPQNQYASYDGTSAAAPVVSGIAALVMEYYPTLSAKQVKYVLEKSVLKLPGLMVQVPGSDAKAEFSSLSKSQGIVNAYNALSLAATLQGERVAQPAKTP
jgi:subtilisin family serine protease